jgi:hypothetical protein
VCFEELVEQHCAHRSDSLPFGRLWYTQVLHAIGYAEFYSRSHDAVIRVFDEAGNVANRISGVDSFDRCADRSKQQKKEVNRALVSSFQSR